MKRRVSDYFSAKAARHVQYLGLAVLRVKNWPTFLSNYLGFAQTTPIYRFRNGLRIKTAEVNDVATILDMFFRKDYGDVPDDSVILDIGANIGAYALFAATTAKNTLVYAFEPSPKNFNTMKDNVALNHLEEKVFAGDDAVTGKNETRRFYLNGGPHGSIFWGNEDKNWGDHNDFMDVHCVSLEQIFNDHALTRCDILKMDCEGAEFDILESTAQKTFEKIKEVRMEYHYYPARKDKPEDLIKFFKAKGYEVLKHEPSSPTGGLLWVRRA